jgi:hypothetical protein
LNRRPAVYETAALPLSYAGFPRKVYHRMEVVEIDFGGMGIDEMPMFKVVDNKLTMIGYILYRILDNAAYLDREPV